MADLKISALPASTTPLAGTEILPIVQSATTRQVSVANLTAGRAVSALSFTASGLTSGRVTYAGTAGVLQDSANLLYSGTDLTVYGITVGRGANAQANTAIGASALAVNVGGYNNTAVGSSTLQANLSGVANTVIGNSAMSLNQSGSSNTAIGSSALTYNLSGSNNVAIGEQSLYFGGSFTASSNNTAVGNSSLYECRGNQNTAIGYQSGNLLTTGTKNVILGSYSGNNGSLDIRTSSNNIVLSDGDGNARAWWSGANAQFFGGLTVTGLTNSGLTSGRVTYAGASGLLSDSANLTFDGTNLTTGGSETAARFIPTGSTVATNGMYLPAANTLGFSTNSTERMRISSAGLVGIGTSSPLGTLGILGSATTTIVIPCSSNGTSVTPVETQLISSTFSNGSFGAGIYALNSFNNTSENWLTFKTTATGNGSPTERMRISSTGTLSLSKVGGSAIIRREVAQGSFGLTVQANATDTISDTNPGASIALGGGPLDDTFEGNITLTAYGAVSALGNRNTIMFVNRSGTNTTQERMRIDYLGNLLVGTTSTYAPCAGKISVISSSGSTATPTIAVLNPDATAAFVAFSDTATVFGSITRAASAVLYNTTSDQRLKTNITDAPTGNIDSIKVRSFDWTADNSHQEYGMVAQELLEVAPYAVHQPENPDDMMQVDYSKLVPMMVKEIQDLKARLLTLENK